MKRIINLLATIILLSILLVGCNKASNIVIDIDALATEATEAAQFEDILVELNEDLVLTNNYTALQLEDVINSKVYVSSTSAKAEELAIFEAKDEASALNILNAVNERIADLKFGFEGYLPEELSVIDNAVVKNEGKYVLFFVGKNYEKVNSIFDKYLK